MQMEFVGVKAAVIILSYQPCHVIHERVSQSPSLNSYLVTLGFDPQAVPVARIPSRASKELSCDAHMVVSKLSHHGCSDRSNI